jgi:type IV pilus assembly protein PilC
MAKKLQRSVSAKQQTSQSSASAPRAGGKKRKTGRVAPSVVNEFTLQLATLSTAGIPIVRALGILQAQTKQGPFKEVLSEVHDDVSGGTPLSESLGKHERVFDSLYASMVHAGEAGGVLDTILKRLSDYRERAADIKAKITGAMIYPVIILMVAALLVTAVIVFVIPKFDEIFTSMDIELPGITTLLLDTSAIAVKYWYLVFGLPVLTLFFHMLMMKKGGGYRYTMHGLLLKIPFLGVVLQKSLVASFSRTFGTLLQAGVPHLDALEIVRDTSTSEVMIEGVESIRRTVREGEGISRPMEASGIFDDLVCNMVDVGEQTGELDNMLLQVADAYEAQADRRIDAMFKIVEPVMIVLIAGFVGFIIVALFLPLTSIMSALQAG